MANVEADLHASDDRRSIDERSGRHIVDDREVSGYNVASHGELESKLVAEALCSLNIGAGRDNERAQPGQNHSTLLCDQASEGGVSHQPGYV